MYVVWGHWYEAPFFEFVQASLVFAARRLQWLGQEHLGIGKRQNNEDTRDKSQVAPENSHRKVNTDHVACGNLLQTFLLEASYKWKEHLQKSSELDGYEQQNGIRLLLTWNCVYIRYILYVYIIYFFAVLCFGHTTSPHIETVQQHSVKWLLTSVSSLHVAQSANDMSATSMLLWNTEKGEETLNFLEEAKVRQKGQRDSKFQLWIMLVNFAAIFFDWKRNSLYPRRIWCMHVEDHFGWAFGWLKHSIDTSSEKPGLLVLFRSSRHTFTEGVKS